VASWADVRAVALGLPEVTETCTWRGAADLEELLTEAWLLRAPVRLRKAFASHQQD
jgi:hypothetical protein